MGKQFSAGAGDTAPLPRVGPPAPPPRSAAGLVLKGAALVGVAVVAGLLWWLVRHDDTQPLAQQPSTPAVGFDFTLAEGPQVSTDCAAHSYSKTKQFFADHPCSRLSRALYTTTSKGAKALVSVVLVTMPDAEQARQLKNLTDREGTGNVDDLVKDGTAKLANAPQVYRAQYGSRATGREVTIVMADFFQRLSDDPLLKRIADDALRLSDTLRR